MKGKKTAVLLYPYFSMQEISCLTAALAVWYGEQPDIYASSLDGVRSEDGFFVRADKTLDEFDVQRYSCLILPGILNPLPALFDENITAFLKGLKGSDILIAAISSAPILLAKAGLLEDVHFTSGVWEDISLYLDFIPEQNILHQPLVHDKNIITAIGFAFREFAAETIRTLGLDPCEKGIYNPVRGEYTESELTYFMRPADFEEFKQEYEEYAKASMI